MVKRLSTIIITIFFPTVLGVSSSSGTEYDTDFLEPGNPGGWETGLNTFDADQDVAVGEMFAVEIWIRHSASRLGGSHR